MNAWERLRRSAEKPERRIVGLMSGTSVDGVDAALVRVSGSGRATRVAVDGFVTHPFPAGLRERVLAVSHGDGNAEAVSRLAWDLGRLFADAAEAVLAASGVPAYQLDAVASHGQTVSHTAPHATLQIGEASVIARRLGVPVLSDFRAADLAAGGQGAPLVPYADWCLLTHPTKARAVQNIGGIGNVTFLPADAVGSEVIGFDTGPGNMLIDRAAAWATNDALTYDRDGLLAADGCIDFTLLESLLEHPFLHHQPPKSAGREEFGDAFWEQIGDRWRRMNHGADGDTRAAFLRSPFGGEALRFSEKGIASDPLPARRADLAATLTAFTALSIADAYGRFLPRMPDEVIVGGGGARNPTLMRLLAEKLHPIPVLTHEEVGMNSDSKEAVAFAVLANDTLLGNPSNLPSVTGADRPAVLGKITPP